MQVRGGSIPFSGTSSCTEVLYSPENMRQAGRNGEKIVLERALWLVFEDRVFINGNKSIILE